MAEKSAIESTSPGSHYESESVTGREHDHTSRLRQWARALSIETGGIQRVTEDDRRTNTTHVWNACTFWFSANFAVATVSTGMVGPEMGLNFWTSFAVIVVVNVLTCAIPAWTASFGLTGLRMTTFSRYSFGYWGNILVVVFSCVATTGWNAINSISGASCLAAVSDGRMPAWTGVIVLTVCVWIICVLGITWIHKVDAFVWIFPLIVWCVTAGTGAEHFEGNAVPAPKGESGADAVLSFIAVIFSFALSWSNCSADFNVRMPVGTSTSQIFFATYVGICLPSILVQSLGAALYTGAQTDPSWKDAFDLYGVGGPLAKALEPAGRFGKLLMVLAGLSAIPNNVPNNYAFGLHAQNFGPWAIKVPRIVFVTAGFIVAVTVGCLASLSFSTSLQTFLSIIGYWTVIHIVLVAEEHIIFRKCRWSSYDLDGWDKPQLLPFGWSAIGAFCFGFLGAALGMRVPWYRGPIARLIGGGANVGHELTFAFSAITFPPLRWLEKQWLKR